MSTCTIPIISYWTLFSVFFKLGCVSFGGPAAHLVFFHRTLVQQHKWLTHEDYTKFMALSQCLPGPTSSQVGIAIGLHLKGYMGAFISWLGFTLPSALVMACIAVFGLQFLQHFNAEFFHVIHLSVIAVVAWAFWQMLRSFCQGIAQYSLMLFVAVFVYLLPTPSDQLLALVIAAVLSLAYALLQKNHQDVTSTTATHQPSYAYIWLVIFAGLLFTLPILATTYPNTALIAFEKLYSNASLVFGGGHVILPLLHHDLVSTGLISQPLFDLGYAMAQLMPGPLFSFGTYLGTALGLTSSHILNAVLGTIAIFLPAFLLIFGALPYWQRLMQNRYFMLTLNGLNAAVVGLLLSLVLQMGTQHVLTVLDAVFVILVVALLASKIPTWLSLIASFTAYYCYLTLL